MQKIVERAKLRPAYAVIARFLGGGVTALALAGFVYLIAAYPARHPAPHFTSSSVVPEGLGYLSGTTQYKDLSIGDGRGKEIAKFSTDGSTKAGNLTVNGTVTVVGKHGTIVIDPDSSGETNRTP